MSFENVMRDMDEIVEKLQRTMNEKEENLQRAMDEEEEWSKEEQRRKQKGSTMLSPVDSMVKSMKSLQRETAAIDACTHNVSFEAEMKRQEIAHEKAAAYRQQRGAPPLPYRGPGDVPCANCKRSFTKSAFSAQQLKKARNLRRCRDCLQKCAATAKTPTGGAVEAKDTV